jgi:SAM-dependent methyltransferase
MDASAADLTGIELLADRAAEARSRLPAALTLIEGDATTAPIASSSQDAVLAFTVFSSLLDNTTQDQLAASMWSWVKSGGGLLCYDFAIDNPRNPDVRGVPVRRLRQLFPEASLEIRRVTLAPPLARAVARVHPALVAPLSACLPFLKTHRLVWALKP